MATLLLRFAAPMQAWGIDAKFEVRRTEAQPTKSGVVGMIAAALGRHRDDPVDDLNELRFGVRTDREGVLVQDFHTAKAEKSAYVTRRWYLADAVFLVGIESNDIKRLETISEVLCNPVYSLYLGRRSCPPTQPLVLNIVDSPLEDALRDYPWLVSDTYRNKHDGSSLRITVDASPSESNRGALRDVPISFNPACRKYSWRKVKESYMKVDVNNLTNTIHDPMEEL